MSDTELRKCHTAAGQYMAETEHCLAATVSATPMYCALQLLKGCFILLIAISGHLIAVEQAKEQSP